MRQTVAALMTALLLAVGGASIIAAGDSAPADPVAGKGGFEWDHKKGIP